jgi:hypothetical protein
MPTPPSEVFVNKLSAARRLLRAAVRLYCSNEDALAVHVVASSGYNILNELKRKRGLNEAHLVAETEMFGFLKMAQDMVSWKLPKHIAEDEYTRDFLERLATKLSITEETDVSSLEMSVDVDSQYSQTFHRKRTHAFNFLKHANDDPQGLLNESAVDNFALLMNAMFSYESLAPDDLGLEGATLVILFLASCENPVASSHPWHDIVEKLRSMNQDERLEFCSFQLNRPRSGNL